MTEDQVTKVAKRIELIYERVRHLEERNAVTPRSFSDDSEALDGPLPTRLESVHDDVSGLRYAAWCIGETLAAVGGLKALDAVFQHVERGDTGSGISYWLGMRWDGVPGWHA